MSKNEQLLAAFKKSNKVRRESMAKRLGFVNADAYRAYLESQISGGSSDQSSSKKKTTKKSKSGKKPLIHIVDILDASGSMSGGKFTNALKGINEEIKELKKDDSVEYTFTYVSFDHTIKTPHYKVPIQKMEAINDRTGGTTALNQAIGETLEKLNESLEKDSKVLVKIFTDGGENASTGRYASGSVVKKFIKECEAKGFTITFVGTKQDVAEVNRVLGIDLSNTLTHDNTTRGVQASFSTSLSATTTYSKKVLAGEDVLTGFYKSKDETL